jgi:hypothetical protein
MKIKSLIKLICLILLVAVFGAWAFGANVTVFTKKFVAWDKNMFKGNDIGMSHIMVYTISSPDKSTGFDTHAAAINAVDVFKARAELMGYKSADIRLMGKDKVFVALPTAEATVLGGTGMFEYNGALTVAHNGVTAFTNKDIKSAKFVGPNADYDAYCVDVTFTKEAAQKVRELSSVGAGTFKFAIDSTKITSEYKFTSPIKSNKITLEFPLTSTNVQDFAYLITSGNVDGKIALTDAYVLEPQAGNNAFTFVALAALVMLVLAGIYFVLSNRMLGLAAFVSSLIAVIALEFFAATFSWMSINAWSVAGLLAGVLFIIIAHAAVLNSISKQYSISKDDAESAIVTGARKMRAILFEAAMVAAVVGIGLWMIGTSLSFIGMAIMGGAIIAALTAMYLVAPIARIFMGLGASDAKALGLKRGE